MAKSIVAHHRERIGAKYIRVQLKPGERTSTCPRCGQENDHRTGNVCDHVVKLTASRVVFYEAGDKERQAGRSKNDIEVKTEADVRKVGKMIDEARAYASSYYKAKDKRDRLVSENRSRRMKGEKPVDTGKKLEKPVVFVHYENGEWNGVIRSSDELEELFYDCLAENAIPVVLRKELKSY